MVLLFHMLSDVVRAEDFWVSFLSHMTLFKDDLIHEGDDDPCSQADVTQGHCLPPRDEGLALICV